MELNNEKAKEIKKDFPIFESNPELIYLDSAATSQKPKKVTEAIKDFYENYNANIHRGIYSLSEKATEKYEESRRVIGNFIKASNPEKEIIFTKNTTESLNLLAYSLNSIISEGKNERNEIVLSQMEHHSNLVPWQQLAKREGMKLKFIKMKDNFEIDLKDARQKITEKTAIVSITHVSNSLGTVNPVKKIIKLAKEKNKDIITIVDAAQSVPHMKLDVKELGCDFLAFSGHKILGSLGIGVLYGKQELLEEMEPFNFGGDMIRKVDFESSEWNELPMKFEAGTQNVAGAVGLAEAVRYIENIGIDNIEKWEKELTGYALKKIKEIPEVELYSAGNNVGILSFNIKGIHPHDVASLLDEEGIAIRAGHHCNMPLMKKLGIKATCRASFYLYNRFEDIDALIESLKKVKSKFEK